MHDGGFAITSEPGALEVLARSVDPTSSAWRTAVLEYLGAPRVIEEVEAVEALLKRQWHDVARNDASAGDAFQFSEFFAAVGFFKKYKPYGVKFAAPFGYSVFVLRPHLGFSVQLHRVQKVEAFHILEPLPGAFALLGTVEQWENERQAFLSNWNEGRPDASPLVFVPRAGDVFVIDRPEIVHTMAACILEEYATTSNDAVERLHDPYESREIELPSRHPALEDVLQRCHPILPRRRVEPTPSGWLARDIPTGTRVEVVWSEDVGLRAYHLFLERGETGKIEIGPNAIGTLTTLEGLVMCRLDGGTRVSRCGETMPIVPGSVVSLVAPKGATRVAVCEVDRKLAFEDLRSSG